MFPSNPPPPRTFPHAHKIVDTDMAKANANKAPDPETRKLLWLKIARREVERCRSTDIEGTMRVLQVWSGACFETWKRVGGI